MHLTRTPPSAITPSKLPIPTDVVPSRVRLTRTAYYMLFDAGLIGEKCELIDGEIVEKMPQGAAHTQAVRRAERLMRRLFGEEYVYSQTPLVLNEYDEPEPDIFVTTLPETAFTQQQPNAGESRLAVEVSVSTLDYDKGKKASRYALAGVVGYWVLDVTNRKLLVYRNPQNGAYPAPQELTETDTVSPLALPTATIAVKDLLP